MADHTSNTLTAEARDALEVQKAVSLRLQGFDKWIDVPILAAMRSDVGTLQATLNDGSRMVFRKDALLAVHIEA